MLESREESTVLTVDSSQTLLHLFRCASFAMSVLLTECGTSAISGACDEPLAERGVLRKVTELWKEKSYGTKHDNWSGGRFR